jgi:hypothetical protein
MEANKMAETSSAMEEEDTTARQIPPHPVVI